MSSHKSSAELAGAGGSTARPITPPSQPHNPSFQSTPIAGRKQSSFNVHGHLKHEFARFRGAEEMESRFVEIPIDDFYDVFLRSISPNAPLKDLQSLVQDGKVLLEEKFPEIEEIDLFPKARDEKELYPSLVRVFFTALRERAMYTDQPSVSS